MLAIPAGPPEPEPVAAALRQIGMRWLAVVLLVALAGCGTAGTGGTGGTGGSGVAGHTVVDGGCPVQRAGSPCPDRPQRADIVARPVGSGRTAAEVTSASDGTFRVDLAPGRYTLVATPASGAMLPRARPVQVTVRPGTTAHVTIRFDSGIR